VKAAQNFFINIEGFRGKMKSHGEYLSLMEEYSKEIEL
jgi:hypothetical protein